jgi:hypothetical protein
MGIFGRRRQPAITATPDLWQPVQGQDVQHDSAEEIAGTAAVCTTAYRVHFTLPLVPRASVVLWTYAVEADPEGPSPGPYAIGFRCEWWLGEAVQSAWNEEYWESYTSPAAADDAALAYAEHDARTPDRGEAGDEEFFSWDGIPG